MGTVTPVLLRCDKPPVSIHSCTERSAATGPSAVMEISRWNRTRAVEALHSSTGCPFDGFAHDHRAVGRGVFPVLTAQAFHRALHPARPPR